MARRTDGTQEQARLEEARGGRVPWRKWGPYLSDRQWGTVREHLSREREAWDDLTHDQARSRAYQSGEDGIAGFSDDQLQLCFSVALWNGRDPILKERLYGLTNSEGNHGEDVKEYYFYLDSTPTHSYAKMLYKYPQAAFPYDALLSENRRRTRKDLEYELLDTGVFDEDRYWDVFVEYAKVDPEDILIRVTAFNRGPETATLHVLPHLWFRDTWSAGTTTVRPQLAATDQGPHPLVVAHHADLGPRFLCCERASELLFTNNETNSERLWGKPNLTPFVKDGIGDCVVLGRRDAVNPARQGTKAAAHHVLTVPPGGSSTIRLRLTPSEIVAASDPFRGFDDTFEARRAEADEFYGRLIPSSLGEDKVRMIRQSYGGLLWSKQAYIYDVEEWLRARGQHPDASDETQRNVHWFHMFNADVISMPDKWEYPWFAAWDLAFHAAPLAMVDPEFAAGQLDLMLRDRYQHPNGQIPAYEWNFGDVNPPVHAWAAMLNYRLNRDELGPESVAFLKRVFRQLLLNFTWWINRKDRAGKNVFEGGFLGLDNIGVFDRSAPLPTGGYLEQADGTAWMAFYAQHMLDMALELAIVDPTYEDIAIKFYEQVIRIEAATDRVGGTDTMWDEEDGFFYDVLRVPGQWATRLKVRSIVGLLPLCAVTIYRPEEVAHLPQFLARVKWFNEHRPHLFANLPPARTGVGGRVMLSLLTETKLRRVLARMLDPNEFLGDFGIRSLSRYHAEHPYCFYSCDQEYRVSYLPAESDTGMFGGNSNWRGPIWAPINALIVRAMLQMYAFYGDEFRVECPTGSGRLMTLFEVAQELTRRLGSIFLRDDKGRRPVYGGARKFQEDPHWRDHLLFYEYFHGDNGAGLGASHQTGWTAMIPTLVQIVAALDPAEIFASDIPMAARGILGEAVTPPRARI
jgi:Mannosylglycerate hydrolase MGH1-like glycoside hydrolase domain